MVELFTAPRTEQLHHAGYKGGYIRMLPLNARKVRILEAIVHDYVTTMKPVGSERLIEIYQLGCKSATVRNEMAELSELGYLMQPHTSAGRIPTDRGYRYYVDELMNPSGSAGSRRGSRSRAKIPTGTAGNRRGIAADLPHTF